MSSDAAPRRGPKPTIPLTVLTGFLGSGKTTLLNRLLKEDALADTAVIINEFGEIGLDHLFVEAVEDGVIELSSGCLCCTVRGELVGTLEDLLRRLDNGRIKPFRRVVIETTGLADPAPILHTVMHHPYLVMRYRLDGVVATVDAANGAATLDAQEEAVKQAAVADRIVLTKTDIAPGAEKLKARLAALNPGAPILDAAAGEATAGALLDAGLFDPRAKTPDVARWLNEEAYRESGHGHHHHAHDHGHHHHGHAHDHDHAHDVNRHDARIRAFCVETRTLLSQSAFEMFVDLLRSMHGGQLLRVKGIVGIAEHADAPLVVHGVQNVFHPPVRLEAWPDGDRRTRLVVIARDIAPEAMQKLLDAFAGTARTDSPDGAVLAENPLAPQARRGLMG